MGSKRKRKTPHHSKPHTKAPPKPASPPPPLPALPVLPNFKLNNSGPLTNLAPITHHNSSDNGGEFEEVRRVKKQKISAGNEPGFYLSPMRLKSKVKVSQLRDLALWIVGDGIAPQWLLVKGKPEIKRAVVLMVPGFTGDMFDGQRDKGLRVKGRDTTMKEPEEDLGAVVKRDGDGEEEEQEEEKKEVVDETPFDFTPGKRRKTTHSDMFPHKLDESTVANPLKDLLGIFPYAWPTLLDGEDKLRLPSPISSFLRTPLDKEQRKEQNKKHKKTRVTMESLLMTTEDFTESEYPLHSQIVKDICKKNGIPVEESTTKSKTGEEGWVETDVTKKTNGGRKIFAIDCEMCSTDAGKELTRISVVDFNRKCVYDTLVKPANPITDYLTRFSGITEAKLAPVTTTLADVQAHLLNIIDSETILVGHSLDSDLNALKLCHPLIIDTSLLYEHPRGKPYRSSLKYLADKVLHREIQKGGSLGHDSIEDALTCIDLLKMKLEREPGFGSTMQKDESLFTRLTRLGKSGALVDWGNAAFHSQGASTTASCSSDSEVVEHTTRILSAPSPPDFLWARLRSLELSRGWQSPREGEPPKPIATTAAVTSAAASVSKHIRAIYDSLPAGTAFIVYSGIGDPRLQAKYNAMKKQFNTEYKVKKWDELSVKWTDVEEQILGEGVRMAREGVAFLKVKNEEEGKEEKEEEEEKQEEDKEDKEE